MREPALPIAGQPLGYEGLSARAKADWLWDSLITPTIFPPTARPDLSFDPKAMLVVAGDPSRLAVTLDHDHDVMPPGRPKIIHTRGAVAMIELETLPTSPYTGVLGPPDTGGALGLVRMSLAIPPEGKSAVTPGMGIKLLVDGHPSLDLLAMNHTVGQGRDHNLFSNTFTHDLRQEHTELRPPQKVMQYFFKKVTSQPRRLTIDHFAATTSAGHPVAAPNVPHRLIFRPDPDQQMLFRGRHGEDFRETLERIPIDSILYRVEAVQPPDGPGERTTNITIGHVRTRTRFSSSEGGDRLFFRHMIDPEERIDPGRSLSRFLPQRLRRGD